MKKVLSFLLVLMFSLTVFGVTQESKAVAADVTIRIHLLEHDGDTANSGVGLWDGVNWNDWGDLAVDGVVTIEYTTAEAAALGINDGDGNKTTMLEFQPFSNKDDAGNSLTAGGNGKVLLDVADLIDGSATELDAYFVEGAKDFFIKDHENNGLLLFVYSNPNVASNPDVYDGWMLHTWDAGTNGTSVPDYWTGPELDIEVELDAGDTNDIPMMLGGIEVDFDAQDTVGFIMHWGADESVEDKAYWGDIKPDVSDIKPADASTPGGVKLMYYVHGNDNLTADYSTFTTEVAAGYKAALKNKFWEPTAIVAPTTVGVTFFGSKQPWELIPGNFMIKDSEGTAMTIQEVMIDGAYHLGKYESDVVVQSETVVVIYFDTDVALADMGIAGSFQDWKPENALTTTTTDANGYAVFEFSSFDSEVQFKILGENGTDNVDTADVDESTILNWGDNELSGGSNVVVDLSAGGTVEVFIDDATDMYHVKGADVVTDPTMYTYTADAACTDNLLTIFVDTDMDHTKLGIIGSFTNGWSDSDEIFATGETDEGVPYFEVCTTDASGEFKVLYDTSGDGLQWSNADDVEVTTSNRKIMVADGETAAAITIYADIDATLAFTPTLTPVANYLLSVYVVGAADHTMLGLVGDGNPNGWDNTQPLAPSHVDGFGNAIFDIMVSSKTGGFKIFYGTPDEETGAWDWGLSLTNDNITFDMGAETMQVISVDMNNSNAIMDFGASFEDEMMSYSEFMIYTVEPFMYGEAYTIEYVEKAAVLDDPDTTDVDESMPAEILTWDLTFSVDTAMVDGDVVEETGTYALSPTEIKVEFDQAVAPFSINVDFNLKDADGNYIYVNNANYGLAGKIGTFESDTTCTDGQMVYIHFNATSDIAALANLGIVGSIQTHLNDSDERQVWDVANSYNPVGMDSEGNYVFEVCLPATDTQVEFKVKLDPDGDGFTWDGEVDPELTPANVVLDVVADGHYYLEEGESVLGVSRLHMITLTEALDKDAEYFLVLNDVSGIDVIMPVLTDTEAPVVTATIKAGADFTVNNTVTDFDVADYFTILGFVDNREGELEYTIKTPLDLTVAGDITMTIAATDMWGNEGTYDIVFTVVDDTNPELVLGNAQEFEAGTEAPDWATFATSSDGEITVDASGVNMETAGVYYVNYTATDPSGNQTVKALEVTITAAPETGCFSSFSIGSSIGLVVLSVVGGAALFLARKKS